MTSFGTNGVCAATQRFLMHRRSSNAFAILMQQGSWTPRLRRRSQRRGIRRHGSLTPIPRKMVWHLREKWRIPTVKLNGKERSPAQWEDGSYSVEGVAAHLGVDLSA